MFIPFLLLGLFGMLALSTDDETPIRRKVLPAMMGDAGEPKSAKDMERFIKQTMRLSDPREIARRARALSREYPSTAKVVMRRARDLQEALDSETTPAPSELYKGLKRNEPIPIFNLAWTRFVESLVHNPSEVTESGHIGFFLFAPRRLIALGIASNLRKEEKEIKGEKDAKKKKVWVVDFVAPMTLDTFLSSTKAQYDVLVKSILDYLPAVLDPEIAGYVGKVAEGKKITVSGLLAIAQRAGVDNLKKWLANPGERSRYPNTRESFLKSTEVF